MKDLENARLLAETMVWIATQTGRRAVALLSDMNQPLGQAVGNALEVREAIDTLRAGGPPDFHQHCVEVASYMLLMGDLAIDEKTGVEMAQTVLDNGKALEQFRRLVQAQGGDVSYVDRPEKLLISPLKRIIAAEESGYLRRMDALEIGEASVALGAGRAKKGDPIDHAVGIMVHHKVGDPIQLGEPLMTLYANREAAFEEAGCKVKEAIEISQQPVEPLLLFYDIVRSSAIKETDTIC